MKKFLILVAGIVIFIFVILLAFDPYSARKAYIEDEQRQKLYRNSEEDIDREAHRQLEEEYKAQKKAEDEYIQELAKEREEYERQAEIEKRKQELREQNGY